MKAFTYLFLLIIPNFLFAQFSKDLGCHTDEAAHILLEKNAQYHIQNELYEQNYRRHISNLSYTANSARNKMLYTIPMVVHIVHNCAELGSTANPVDAEILQVVEETSQRFRHLHDGADAYSNPHYGVDTEIEFCLATVDPDGNYTTGILRHNDPVNAIGDYQNTSPALIDLYRWDPQRYLNVYILQFTNTAGVWLGGSSRDIVIINSGSFWSGLMAHEIGHYLTLKHTFAPNGEDNCPANSDCLADGDFVCDTPPKDFSGRKGSDCNGDLNSCTSDEADLSENNPYRPVSMGGMGDQPDMLVNYMDYTGGCWDAFSEGQKQRMRFNIESNRMSQIEAANIVCQPASTLTTDIALMDLITTQTPCTPDFTQLAILENKGSNLVEELNFTIQIAESTTTYQWTGQLAAGEMDTIQLPNFVPPVGQNAIEVMVSTNDANPDQFLNNNNYCQTVSFFGANGLAGGYQEVFQDCDLTPEGITLINNSRVFWGQASVNGELDNCQQCFAFTQGYSVQEQNAFLCLPTLDLSQQNGTSLNFKIGYIPRYDFITNTLNVYLSAACDTTTLLWSAGGLDLATNDPPAYSVDQQVELADCNSMKEISIDLSAFDGLGNVEICFESKGRWYSPLILDDIQVEGSFSCSTVTSFIEGTICEGESLEGYAEAGIYQDTFLLDSGCDSIRTLNVFVAAQKTESALTQTICAGESFEGYAESGTYVDGFVNTDGCDSTRTLTLTVLPKIESDILQTICAGESFEGYAESGTYVDGFVNTDGCDSTRTLTLNVLPKVESDISQTICAGEDFEGYTQSGTYIDAFVASSGCDSIRQIVLTVLPLDNENCMVTSVDDQIVTNLMKVYPNPASDFLTIEWSGTEAAYYSIFSYNGTKIIMEQPLEKITSIPLNGLPSGVYWVKVQTIQGIGISKLTKM